VGLHEILETIVSHPAKRNSHGEVDAPSGAITLLFTDIEGSTKLLQRSGDLYPELLAEHRRLLRAAFEAQRGYEVDTEGDAFFVTFESADDAAAAATAAQRALAEHRWPDGHRVRVRMGLHSGEPRLTEGGYVGLDVHRAARVMASGHGGQIVLSHSTRRQLGDGWAVVELGEHQLKDLLQPEPLYQLNVAGLPGDFPPLKTLGNRPTNLPTQPNLLVGREAELREIANVLRSGDVRLLTLTGPGGTGKTRLALQSGADLLDDFRSGVFFVSLAPVTQDELLLETVARTLAVQEVAGESIAETLKSYLADKRMLLILDNLEQIVGGAPAIAELLEAARDVHVLATSRERLRLTAEHVYDVPPLTEDEAVTLFVARAQAAVAEFTVDGDAEIIATLCRRLEGLPLALELAAARTTLLSPRALLAKLDERLSILTGGRRDADERQRTLRGTIQWSYDLLDVAEQRLFRDLSVFVDGCRFDAAIAVSDADELGVLDALQSLLDKSLVRRRIDADGESRYWMLETIREYADERAAASGTAELLADRHGHYFLALAERTEPDLWRQATKEWMRRFDAEQANIRSALEWALGQDDAEVAYRLAGALYPYWELRGRHGEARAWLTRVLDRTDEVSPALRMKALIALGRARGWQGDLAGCVTVLEEAAGLGRRVGDDEAVGRCLGFIGHAHLLLGEPRKGAVALDEGVELARRAGDALSLQRAVGNAALAALELRDFEKARAMYTESVELGRAEGRSFAVALQTAQLGYTETLAGDLDSAEARLAEASGLFAELGDTTWTQMVFRYQGLLALLRGDIDRAESLLLTSLANGREQAPAQDLPLWIENLAAVADAKSDRARAATLWGAAYVLFEDGDLAVREENRQVRARYRSKDLDVAAWARGKAMTLDEAIDFALTQETTKR
jgi:predicted ATPase/class 3 adenylate cyclase